jgi:DNA-binding NarL/FixJ family response regulator
MSKTKLAIAEDHKPYREEIVKVLNQEDDFEVILQVDNGKELLENLMKIKPDVILMDIRMPVMDGIEATNQIKKTHPEIKIIALSQYDNESNIIEMNIHGVNSFIGKNDNLEVLFNAIRIVNSGGVYMTEHAARIIQKHLLIVSKQFENESKLLDLESLKKFNSMEIDMLWHIACHKSIKEIAEILRLSPNTINNRQADLREKLDLSGKGKLFEYALSVKRHLLQLKEGEK